MVKSCRLAVVVDLSQSLFSPIIVGYNLLTIMYHNVLRLQEVSDFGYENCLPPMNLIRSTKFHLTTEPPISFRCCYVLWFFLPLSLPSFYFIVFHKQFAFLSTVIGLKPNFKSCCIRFSPVSFINCKV